jgi:hypothetical protein
MNFYHKYTKEIKNLIGTPDFYSIVFGSDSKYVKNIFNIHLTFRAIPNDMRNTDECKHHFGIAIVRLLNNNISTKKTDYFKRQVVHNDEYPRLIKYYSEYIDINTKSNIVDLILKYNRNFSYSARKLLLLFVINNIHANDSRAIDVLNEFYRTLSRVQFEQLMGKIPGGANNKKVKNILSKTKLYEYLKFDEETVNNNFNKKIELTKVIAKTPTIIKRIPFAVKINIECIKHVPPATRFKFLKFAFRHEIYSAQDGWFSNQILKDRINFCKKRANEHRLIIDPISLEEMKELLFSICLHKNDELTKWLIEYKIYLECLKSDRKVDVYSIRKNNYI